MENITPLNFWSQVWHDGTIRFHQKDYNLEMTKFFSDIDLKGKTVLIPLAGKTLDIIYFLERGAHVTAIEFVEQAIIDFYEDHKIQYKKNGNLFESLNLKFYAINFYEFKSDTKFDILYDRASQVVFSRNLRPTYYDHIGILIDSDTTVLLAAIDHEGPDDYGPPFKIAQSEIISAYKKMGIQLKIFSEKKEIASDKMQNSGIMNLNSYFLTNF